MTTRKLYLAPDAPLETTATILHIDRTTDGALVRLDQTLFHPQGGGQRADRGTLGTHPVRHVTHTPDADVLHHLDPTDVLAEGDLVTLIVDPAWRLQNATLHTLGHALAAVAEELYPSLRATGGHHWPGESRIDLIGTVSDPAEVVQDRVARRLAACVAAELPITVLDDAGVRRIHIGDFPSVPCGGTHLRTLAQVAEVYVRKVRLKGGQVRISYDAVSLSPAYDGKSS